MALLIKDLLTVFFFQSLTKLDKTHWDENVNANAAFQVIYLYYWLPISIEKSQLA